MSLQKAYITRSKRNEVNDYKIKKIKNKKIPPCLHTVDKSINSKCTRDVTTRICCRTDNIKGSEARLP